MVLLASFISGGLLFPLLPLLTCSRFEWLVQSRTRTAIRRKYNLPVRATRSTPNVHHGDGVDGQMNQAAKAGLACAAARAASPRERHASAKRS